MGIESPAITDGNGNVFPEVYEMPNGCLCCSAKTDLARLIEFFCERKKDIDYILIEANGLADISEVCHFSNFNITII